MSLKYRDKNGNETPIAGLNGLSGELVYGASTVRSGTATLENVSALSAKQFFIEFDTPMPDNDYQVVFQSQQGDLFVSAPYSKNTSGFYIMAMRSQGNAYNPVINYYAFKLYTVEGVEQLENDVAELKTNTKGGIISLRTTSNTGETVERSFTSVSRNFFVLIGGWDTSGRSYRNLYLMSVEPRANTPVIKLISSGLGEVVSNPVTAISATLSNNAFTISVSLDSATNLGMAFDVIPL